MTAVIVPTSAIAIVTIFAILVIFFVVWTNMIIKYQSDPEPCTHGSIDDLEGQIEPKDVSSIRSFLSFSSRVCICFNAYDTGID